MAGGVSASNYSRGTNQKTNETDAMYSHLPALDRGIIRFFKDNPPTSEGYHVRQIIKVVKGLVAEETKNTGGDNADTFAYVFLLQILTLYLLLSGRAAIQRLTEEGLLFSTLDEQHYNLC